MNPIEILLQHKTIREYKHQAVDSAQLNVLIDVAKHTATSTGMQTFSMIHLTDAKMKKILAEEICMQPYIARVPAVFIFVVDAYRNSRIAREQGVDLVAEADSDRFFQGWTDACLAAQNMVAAAELAGFGTMYMGSILNDAPRVIDMLHLPKLTFPVVGVGLGIGDQKPQLKPRMPRELNVFENSYQTFDNYMDAMEEYDEEMGQYYDMRDLNNRVDCFTKQVTAKLAGAMPMRAQLFNQIRSQGFLVD